MTWKLLPLAVLVSLAGCSAMSSGSSGGTSSAASPKTASADGPVSSGAGGDCESTAVQGSVGKAFNQSLLDQLRTTSGSQSARVLKPGQMITMEYNTSRLNVLVDDKNVITAVRCG